MSHTRRTLFALSALALLPALARADHDDRDEGEYRILYARYGTAEQQVDVTERLKQLAREDERFRAGNEAFGVDPAPGRRKTLRIVARGRDGQQRVFEYREGSRVDGREFIGWRTGRGWGDERGGWRDADGDGRDSGRYRILEARYGTPRRHVDVTERLRQLARQDLRFRVENERLGVDPDPGRRKQLRLFVRDRQGEERVFEYDEGAVVDGALFTGWQRGDWGHERRERDWSDERREEQWLQVHEALWGADSRWADVTAAVRAALARGGQPRVSNELLGVDPARRVRKTLRLRYQRGRGPLRELELREGEPLALP
ncbi:hypothetical protein [Inhella proteolytica]|uniref:Uncharacterized protein n=1 Tax=Inhella proteolytica TaxID=2795029 RepID=A0A931IZC5_9BURK|nr:hypothetical protein [Inhella proteolytica]MBH9575828.1 hypothetical protein [Inhella proteolytica]